jgi:hypothetical protein
MQRLDGRKPDQESGRALGRWLIPALAACVLIGAVLATAVHDSPRPHATLDTEKVERAIEHSILAQRGKYAQVTCPSGTPQHLGLAFSCAALVGRETTRFRVTELDGAGNVRYEAR